MLVHNEVLKDARVIKEASTLRGAGYTVEIHGISADGEPKHCVVPGTDIDVFLRPKQARTRWLLSRLFTLTALGMIALGVTLLQFALFMVLAGIPAAVSLVVASVLNFVLITVLYVLRYRLPAWRRRIKYFILGQIDRFNLLGRTVHNASFKAMADALKESVGSRPPPDIIHIHDHVALISGRALKSRHRVPLIWDAHEIYEDLAAADSTAGRMNAAIIIANQQAIDGFVTINESIGAFYDKNYPQLPKSIIVMNATVPQLAPNYDGRLHDAAKLPRHQKILLYQGGFAPKRGLTALVKAAALLTPDWTVVLMGWGSLEEELRALGARASRGEGPRAVVFLPGVPQNELQIWSVGAALGAIPYENIGLNHLYCTPNKLWEYPCAQVPILATDLVEMAAVVRQYEIGFLLPREFDEHDIARVVNAIGPDDLQRARRNCSTFISRSNWDCYAPRLLELYAKLSAGRGPVLKQTEDSR
jgi:glycosyltransferase involved in cell wall biosynthesis